MLPFHRSLVLPFTVLLALASGSLQAQDALTFPQAAPQAPLQPSPQGPLQTAPQALLKPKLSALAEVPDWSKLEALGGMLTREEFERAMQEIYTDGSKFPVPWRIEGNALVVETSPGRPTINILFRESNQPAVRANRYWRTPSELPALKADEPVLTGVHIALDPGHIGGAWARVEERWLSMKEGEAIQEGTMSLQVAKLLKPRLEALGAIVALVRPDENPVSKLKPDDLRPQARAALLEAGVTQPVEYYSSNQEEARIISVQWQAEKLFYRVSEIRARAKRVNEELHPDLVLCLHFNAEAWGDPKNPSFVDKNHFHLLINGCYSPEELQLEDVRFEMLRRLFSRTEAQELAMAGPTADAMMQATGLPPYIYNTSNARRVSGNAAVFARNLLANRLFQCPVLYYEPYVMNHGQTYQRLLLGHYLGRTLLGDQLISSPIEDYARGVVRGLVNYYTEARRAK